MSLLYARLFNQGRIKERKCGGSMQRFCDNWRTI
jgi:hypothetical protein